MLVYNPKENVIFEILISGEPEAVTVYLNNTYGNNKLVDQRGGEAVICYFVNGVETGELVLLDEENIELEE